ncbi:MAG: hypothetical protein JHC93_04970, partial [Parachlamydiales bacterium]|nr:hypothetical protein [Parachlamydiales bacterium]
YELSRVNASNKEALEQAAKELDKAQQAFDKAKAEHAAQVEDLTNQKDDAIINALNATENLNKVQQALENAKNEAIENANKSNAALEDANKKLQKANKGLEEAANKLKAVEESARYQNEMLKEALLSDSKNLIKINDLKNKLLEAGIDLDEAKQNALDAAKNVNNLSQELDETKNKLEDLTKAKSRLEEGLEKANAAKEELQNTQKGFEDKFSRLNASNNKALKQAAAELKNAQDDVSALRSDESKRNKEMDELQAVANELMQIVEDQVKKNNDLINDSNQANEKTKELLDTITKENNDLRIENDELKDLIEKFIKSRVTIPIPPVPSNALAASNNVVDNALKNLREMGNLAKEEAALRDNKNKIDVAADNARLNTAKLVEASKIKPVINPNKKSIPVQPIVPKVNSKKLSAVQPLPKIGQKAELTAEQVLQLARSNANKEFQEVYYGEFLKACTKGLIR